MGDLKSVKLMYLKAVLFVLGLGMAITVILVDHFSWKLVFLLAITVWFSARIYYFMFYVIANYVDPSYKFAGVWSFVVYLCKRDESKATPPKEQV